MDITVSYKDIHDMVLIASRRCVMGLLPGGRFYQCGRVQVVDLVELQKRGQVVKLLVTDFKPLGG